MASRPAARALRQSVRQLASPAVQRRTFVSAVGAARAGIAAAPKAAVTSQFQQTRGVKTIDFAGTKETVYEREDWPREKLLVSRPRPN
jgi:ketol-acid reductoisomerase